MQMRVADLMRDSALLPTVQQIAAELGEDYPDQVPRLIRRWIGSASEYGNV
jgi:ATP-dependent DNA helicase RecG